MESINFAKGYGKVNTSTHLQPQDQPPHRPTKSIRNPLTAVASAVIVLLILLLAVHNHNSNQSLKKPEQHLPPSASAADSIRFVCNVTRYPNPCFTAISSAMDSSSASDPEAILKVSIRVSLTRISDLASLFRNSSTSKSPAVDDCVDQLEEAKSNLKQSIAAMEEKALTEEKIADLKTWISAAMTDEETCRDGMEEMGAAVAEGMKAEMEDCTEMMSNSLAILANLPSLLQISRLRFH